MHQLAVMDKQFCVVPFWTTPSPEADNLLSECFVGYDDNNASKANFSDSKFPTGQSLEEDLENVLERMAVQNEEQFLCSVGGERDRSSYYDGSDVSWLDEFMNVYGITTLDSNDDFNMRNIGMTIVETSQAKKNHPAVMLTKEMKNSKIFTNKCVTQLSGVSDNVSMISIGTVADANMSSIRETNTTLKSVSSVISDKEKVLDDNVQQRSNSQKFAANRKTCFDGISERKREQNRCAAIRYRGKRREEAKQKKQELYKLELRNIELKTEMNWLEKEVIYLKSLMKLTKSF
ncbi:bZIP transcription factor family protein [Acanthocheilonema viteae]